ncbi:hypothetical protein BDQ17DRAFT_1234497 [Cyathus striatus]|nr:hypothetical protein BDQ17DRAFT_1234497 [Cyathus striatus]
MGQHKERSHIEIQLDDHYLKLKGTGPDVEPVRMAGNLILYLAEDTALKEVSLSFRGKARVPIPAAESMISTGTYATYIVCANDWTFLKGDKRHSQKLKAGRHVFDFNLQLGGSLPSSIASTSLGGICVSYKLRALATRPGIMANNLQCIEPVYIMRTFTHEALEYQTTLEIENSWPEKIMYSIMLPHKAWAAGDKLQALVKFSPLVKGAAVLSVVSTINENIKAYARSGHMEENKVVATARHEIVHGKAVQVEELRGVAAIHAHSASSSGSSSAHHSPVEVTHHHHEASGAEVTQLSARASPVAGPSRDTSPPPPESIDHLYSSENNDVVTHVTIELPSNMTPSSPLEPIMIHHRVKWSILILNPDGHTSELRCSLPIYVLDHHLLAEARSHTAATRRLLFGMGEEQTEEEYQELPSYNAHVRDRVANMFLPESSFMRIPNPWVVSGTSPTILERNDPLQAFSMPNSSGGSTPLEAHLFSHLPHAPGSGDSTPLEWVNSELLLSISENPPPVPRTTSRTSTEHTPPESASAEGSRTHSGPHSRRSSRPNSRPNSRPHSRASSPDRASNTVHGSPELGRDNAHAANRNLTSLIKATMKPFTSLGSHHHGPGIFSRHGNHSSTLPLHPITQSASTSSRESINSTHGSRGINLGDVNQRLQNAGERSPRDPQDVTAPELLHRAFTEVPSYNVASQGWIGGVIPLDTMQGLPSYEEAAGEIRPSMSEGDLTRMLQQQQPARGALEVPPLQRVGTSRSDDVLAAHMSGLSVEAREELARRREQAREHGGRHAEFHL